MKIDTWLARRGEGRLGRPRHAEFTQDPANDLLGLATMAANIRGLADVSFDRIACKIRQRNVSTAIGNHEYLPVLASSSLSGVAGQGAGPALAGGTRTLVGAGKLTVPNFSLPSVLTGEHPSRFHLQAVQDFFNYTEIQGGFEHAYLGLGYVFNQNNISLLDKGAFSVIRIEMKI